MTRDEQVVLIKRSVAEWNQWRLNNATIRANLQGADLQGATKIEHLTARVYRSDDCLFIGFTTDVGLMIKAGRHLFSPSDYRQHIEDEYPRTDKARETLRIIQYIEDCAKEKE